MGDVRDKDVGVKPEPDVNDHSSMLSTPSAETIDRAFAGIASTNAKVGRVSFQETAPETKYLDELVSKTSADELEAGVAVGVQLLESLKTALYAAVTINHPESADWLDAIQQLQGAAKPSRTVVGVVLVPTNGMRACTASATEISYNYSGDPSQLYRAEIEFISAADWAQELKILLADLLGGSGNISTDCTNPDTDAGLAYAKIKAVYPNKTRKMIAASTPDALANENSVRRLLGDVKRLK
ncbi:unnamed protein product [Discula destructiva]